MRKFLHSSRLNYGDHCRQDAAEGCDHAAGGGAAALYLVEGDIFTLVDLGEGALMLMPQVSEVARLGDEVARQLEEEQVSLEDLLNALDEEREAYYREHYEEA
ncbi:MAG: hypothetical protein MUF84_12645 [Anaerolineae bacterium]|nr:hypothetical protein [Anaerolineae bacterium]